MDFDPRRDAGPVDPARLAVALMFFFEPTDRALAGWKVTRPPRSADELTGYLLAGLPETDETGAGRR